MRPHYLVALFLDISGIMCHFFSCLKLYEDHLPLSVWESLLVGRRIEWDYGTKKYRLGDRLVIGCFPFQESLVDNGADGEKRDG
jgi:hypothetical protein